MIDMNSYFFIPASKLHKLESIKNLGVDHIIIDFEDSMLEKDRWSALEEVKRLKDYRDYWYRIPFRNKFEDEINLDYLTLFTNMGINLLVFPKLKDKAEIIKISEHLNNQIRCILLVEHPRLLFDLELIIRDKAPHIDFHGLGLGSHDLTSIMNMANNKFVLDYPKIYLAYLSKAFNFESIDVASMELKDSLPFKNEIYDAQELAYNGKFIIHPIQVEWLKDIIGYKATDIQWAQEIVNALPVGYNVNDIEPFVINGKIIEKMHIKNALKILNK